MKVVDSDNASDMAAISRYNIRISKDKSYELSWHARTERSSQSYQLSILCLDQNNETFPKFLCQKCGAISGKIAIDRRIPAKGMTQ